MPSSADQDALKVMEGRVWGVAVARQLSVQLLSYTVSLWRRRSSTPPNGWGGGGVERWLSPLLEVLAGNGIAT